MNPRRINSCDRNLQITMEDGKQVTWTRQSDEHLDQWYWRTFTLIAENLGFDDCVQPNQRIKENVDANLWQWMTKD